MEHAATDSLLFQSFIFLASAVFLVPLAKKTGLGSVLGYLIAGLLIGPHVFGLVGDTESVLHFSEFGVVMMLFLIGMELNPHKLWKMRTAILGLGGLQVLLTTLCIGGLLYLIGESLSVAAAVALALALSSTAIVLQVMAERGINHTYSGQSAFSVLLFQDIAVIPILALIPVIGGGALPDVAANPMHMLGGPAKVLGAVIAIIVIGHYGIRHLLRMVAKTEMREIFTATALLLVIGVALVMELAGLSPALGAFVAGVVLADSEYRHEIEIQVAAFKNLLLGLFFISVGMVINVDIFLSQPAKILFFVLGLITVKFVILSVLAKFFKMSLAQNMLFSTLLAQGGEFAFVILQFAFVEKVITNDTLSFYTVVVALSMAMTPLLVLANDKLLQPRLFSYVPDPSRKPAPQNDAAPVIIAGYGRFGQVTGRLLHAEKIPFTVLEHDPNQIELLKRFGWKAYYGDAGDMEILEHAGAKDAKILVMAINDKETSVRAVAEARKKFPHLKIIARAYDRRHAYELDKAGADYFQRETFESALHTSREVLHSLGYRAFRARDLAMKFAAHDKAALVKSFAYFEDETKLMSFATQTRDDLTKLFEYDREYDQAMLPDGWEEENLYYMKALKEAQSDA
ncbi:MAG: monovalent cation:proton antiporter-2 (CPA2) family protein [Pseudobdellovibrionaceae bacterium]